jgi:multicomponent Na+:H+ antiporter subunit F
MNTLSQAYQILFIITLVLLGIGMIFALIRAIRGPRIADRIMGINMVGTMTIASIAVLAVLLHESALLDVCLIYCMISFVAVVVLAKVFITRYLEKAFEKDPRGGASQ